MPQMSATVAGEVGMQKPASVRGRRSGSRRKKASLSDDAAALCHPVVLCLHPRNLQVNPHGLGIRSDILKHVYDENSPDCLDCRRVCTKKPMQCVTVEDLKPSKLMKRRMALGFSLADASKVKSILSNSGLGRFYFLASQAVAVEFPPRESRVGK